MNDTIDVRQRDAILAAFKPTAEQVENARRTLRAIADGWLDGTSDSMMPQLYVLVRGVSDDGPGEIGVELFALAVDFDTAVEKNAILFTIGQDLYARKQVPLIVGLTAECWRAQERDGKRTFILPEDDPDRQEGLMIFVMGNGTEGDLCYHDFRRVRRNEGIMLPDGDWESSEAAKVRSSLVTHVFRGFFSAVRHLARG